MSTNKTTRSLTTRTQSANSIRSSLYGNSNSRNIVWGSQGESHFIDVLSVGPIGGVREVLLNGTDFESGEFPDSNIFTHIGDKIQSPWQGGFGYAERSFNIGIAADVLEKPEYTTTTLSRDVSSVAVVALRVNFTTSGFTQRDDKNRKKAAEAVFEVQILNSAGLVVQSQKSFTNYYAKNPTSVPVTVKAPSSVLGTIWKYRVLMKVKGENYGTVASGSWNCSTGVEIYKDTQTYSSIAFASGTIRASDVSGKIPSRKYVTDGYKVNVPQFVDVSGNMVFTGSYTQETSNSHAWNAMAVLTNTEWGAGLPIDKININSFLRFEEYCAEQVDGERRYEHSQYLIKADNFYRIASQIVGSADGKLYEDTSGRIGILIDRKQDERRLINTYDIIDGRVERVDTPDSKKVNTVYGTFEDQANKYDKSIVELIDDDAVVRTGLIKKEIKLDTTTRRSEANRIIKKVLANSQHLTTAYSFQVGYSHEDLEVGNIIELYDSNYSNVEYCGKVGTGSTGDTVMIDPRTPIDLSAIDSEIMQISFWDGVAVFRYTILSWTPTSIKLTVANLTGIKDFQSFGISQKVGGLKPTLVRAIGVTDNGKSYDVEGLTYNESIYDYTEGNISSIVTPITKIVPTDANTTPTGIQLLRTSQGVEATWNREIDVTYTYQWRVSIAGESILISEGTSSSNPQIFTGDLGRYIYSLTVYGNKDGISSDPVIESIDLTNQLEVSSLPAPTSVGVLDTSQSIVTAYTGRSFNVGWEYSDISEVSGYLVEVIQNTNTLTKYVEDASTKNLSISEVELLATFGEDYGRTFQVRVAVVDKLAMLSTTAQATVSNAAPEAPIATLNSEGYIGLSSATSIPTDALTSFAYVWKSANTTEDIPSDAILFLSDEVESISIPTDTFDYDGGNYNIVTGWADNFGIVGTNTTRNSKVFSVGEERPDPPTPERVVGVTDTTAILYFQHSGFNLNNVKLQRKLPTESAWTDSTVYDFSNPVATEVRGYDGSTQDGYIKIEGLTSGIEYDFRIAAAGQNSDYSDYSELITGGGYISIMNPDSILDLVQGDDDFDIREIIVDGVADMMKGVQTDENLINESIVRETADSTFAATFEQVQASFDTTNASISTLSTTVATENSALAQRVDTVETSTSNNSADITTNYTAFTNEQAAVAAAFLSVNSSIGTHSSSISSLNTSISSEASTRAVADTNLSARITGNENEIATVDNRSIAAIGYCTISSNVSSHETKSTCESAGGVWTSSPLASAVKNVQVTSGASTVSVGSFYQAFKDLEGDLVGTASLGVDTNGVFTGLKVVGGSDISNLTFKADNFKLQDSSGTNRLTYNTSANKWEFKGEVYAENIIGDTAAGATKTLATEGWTPTDTAEVSIVSGNIAAAPYSRVVVLPSPVFSSSDTFRSNVRIRYFKNGGQIWEDGTVAGSGSYAGGSISFNVAANSAATFEVRVEWVAGRPLMIGQEYLVSVFRDSNQITFT